MSRVTPDPDLPMPVLWRVANNPTMLLFECPGCGCAHYLETREGAWSWNGDLVRPTATPSLLINASRGLGTPRCHLFIRDGQLVFLSDSTHALAGKTIPMTPI